MNVKMKIINKIKNLDNSEKDFLLILLAFILVALFLFFSGVFKQDYDPGISNFYFGLTSADIDSIELNVIQNLSCVYANTYNTCYRIDEILIITPEICCEKMGKCC